MKSTASTTITNAPTNYRKVGYFETNSTTSPVEIAENNVYTDPVTGELRFASGHFTGNGTDDRSISVGFRPIYVQITGATGWWVRSNDMEGDLSCYNSGLGISYAANYIQAFESDGFQIGADTYLNYNGRDYYWIAWGY